MPHLPGSPAWQRLASHSTVLDYHLSMLHDAARMEAFRRAIDASVQPGDVVVDLGCGTGVLSFMACEAGARTVYAIEGGPVIEVARELAIDNGFADRIEFLEGWSLDVGIPEPADVLISETLGNAGLDEGIVAWTADARRRLLRPGAVLLPRRLRTWVAGVESADEYVVVADWQRVDLPYDYATAHRRASRTLWYADFTPADLLGQPELASDVDLTNAADETIAAAGLLGVDRDGTLHGLACWFDSLLCEGVTVDNMPPRTGSSWSHGFLPLPEPMAVVAGDRLSWELTVSADGEHWTWQVDHAAEAPADAADADGVTDPETAVS
jgi:protein arginine N-methyltransferase 1